MMVKIQQARMLFGLACLTLHLSMVQAQTAPAVDKEVQEDIQRHRAMASAHESAARCLESGKKHEVCEKELQASCKGLAIGKSCGLKHQH